MKTTRILAEVDDETSGTECDYELRDTEHCQRSGSPWFTEGVSDDNKEVDDNVAAAAGISICVSLLSYVKFFSHITLAFLSRISSSI